MDKEQEPKDEGLYLVLLSSGLDNPALARSALMFATVARAAYDLRTVVYCVQNGADVLVKGGAEKEPPLKPGLPTMKQRLAEALEAGVELQVCEVTAINKGIREEDLIPGARITGAATLIDLSMDAVGSLSF
ncbi:MAG: DsrE family protein [Thermaerobacter sp.]|jgi:predicted peroxiredoxin|nr:DsrE family protein [Thermaerobacter sp.]